MTAERAFSYLDEYGRQSANHEFMYSGGKFTPIDLPGAFGQHVYRH